MPIDEPHWTGRQLSAITSVGRDVLVSASAGTGKTAVLSKRCANLLADIADRTDTSEILVLTFTNASAGEMRSRIAEQLRGLFIQTRTAYIRQQLLTIDAACISTIHAFCKRVITENFQLLGIDPSFRIIESDEQTLLKSEVLEKTIDLAWQDLSLVPGLHILFCHRDIQSEQYGFAKRIVQLSDFLDSVANRSDWYQRAAHLSDAAAGTFARLVRDQKQAVEKKLTHCRDRLLFACKLDAKFIPPGYWSEHITSHLLSPVERCLADIRNDDIGTCVDIIRGFCPPRFKNRPKGVDPSLVELIKSPAQAAVKDFRNLINIALINPDYESIVAPSVSVQTKVVIELIKRFDRLYTQAKDRLNCLDFADLEHLMLRLLTEQPQIAVQLRERFRYIFVDEYQDTNALQDQILRKISRSNNIFVVGDVKQSIYAFRQARPELFLKRLEVAGECPGPAESALRVDLNENFRSRQGILDFANVLFTGIMTGTVASVDYDERSALKGVFEYESPVGTSSPAPEPPVEFYILDHDRRDEPDEDDPEETGPILSGLITQVQTQAAFIARRIKQLTGSESGGTSLQIYDKRNNSCRGVEYRDIVILMRSPSQKARQYAEILRFAGIPVRSQGSAGYFATTEISDMLSVLRVLDNPRRDIELAAVLRSPLFNLTDTDLAAVVVAHSELAKPASVVDFYGAVMVYIETGPDVILRARLSEIMSQLQYYRDIARRQKIADLIWRIYRDTGYLSFVAGLPNGRQRYANLLKLHERAIQFEGFVSRGQGFSLTRFVGFLENLLEQDQDWAPAEPGSSSENAVRIMSIHKSKGLEFPVVFLAELNHRFNRIDQSGECIIDEDTVGLEIIEPVTRSKLSSMAHQAIAQKRFETTIAEEMRILYVAVTRARDKLILTASGRKGSCEKIVRTASLAGIPLPDWQLYSADSHLDWLLAGLSTHTTLRTALGLSPFSGAVDTAAGGLFSARLISQSQISGAAEDLIGKKHSRSGQLARPAGAGTARTRQLLDKLKSSVLWEYPYKDLTQRPAKQSVTEWAYHDDEFFLPETIDIADSFSNKLSVEDKLSSSVRGRVGTATHLLIQNLDLSQEITPGSIERTIEQLVSRNLIPQELSARIDAASILGFFESGLGGFVLDPGHTILREWPFTCTFQTACPDERPLSEEPIVQGIIDLLVISPEGLTVIDFKSDSIGPGSLAARADHYRKQLCIYSNAASAILKRRLAAAYLYFLTPASAVKVLP